MEQISRVKEEALAAIEKAESLKDLSQLRIAYLGKKGSIQALMSEMKNLSRRPVRLYLIY